MVGSKALRYHLEKLMLKRRMMSVMSEMGCGLRETRRLRRLMLLRKRGSELRRMLVSIFSG
jgi:hypothetical protein